MDALLTLRRFWKQRPGWLLPLLLTALYFATRFIGLNALPVFADESIYIRWAQLFRHDPSQYAFFAMNDGKPPGFIWLLALVLPLSPYDPVIVGRLLSGGIGFLQLLILDRIIQKLGGNSVARVTNALLTIVLPYWLLHHRLALMDGLLTVALSLSLLGLISLSEAVPVQKKRSLQTWSILPGWLLAGVGLGAAFLTKTPALFFAPVFVWWAVFPLFWPVPSFKKEWFQTLFYRLILFGSAGVLGCGIFLTLKIHPAFGSLFGRSTDFTYTLSEALANPLIPLQANIPRISAWMSQYLRPELLSFTLIALLASHKPKKHWLLLGSSFLFLLPFLLLGKTLHARYLLPAVIGVTLSASLFFAEAWERVQKTRSYELWSVSFILLSFFCLGVLRFGLLLSITPNQTPFVLDDREQYLTSWASGHGIREVRELMLAEVAQGKYVTVVTEGSFGTLPDALLLYFDQRPEIQSLRIEGLGQFPVRFLPEWVMTEAEKHPTWLVVNEDRMAIPPGSVPLRLKARFERPYAAPELHVYEVLPSMAQ